MLSQIAGIYSHEESLDIQGRNVTNTNAVRDQCSKAIWLQLLDDAKVIKRDFSSETDLGEGARYLIRHFDELTLYLTEPKLRHTNDMSERLLRPEKQIQSLSLFRNSLAGRFALDIVRTTIQTSIAAKVNAARYLD